MTTRKRPSSKGKPVHPVHPTPPPNPDSNENYAVEYKQFIEEWHAILPEPPLTTTQLRQEYDDALSFLLMLESRINLLEQSEYAAQTAQEGVTPTQIPHKIVYVSARSRSAKERNAERTRLRGDRPEGHVVIIEPRAFIPPYVAEQTPNPLLLYEFFEWAIRAWDKSAVKRSLSEGDKGATMVAVRQVVRCLNNYMQVGTAQ